MDPEIAHTIRQARINAACSRKLLADYYELLTTTREIIRDSIEAINRTAELTRPTSLSAPKPRELPQS